MYEFYTSSAFQGYQEHKNWSSNKEVMQVPKLEENQQTLQHLQQERLLYFYVFRHHMSSYCSKPYMDGFYTSRAFQQYQERPNRRSRKYELGHGNHSSRTLTFKKSDHFVSSFRTERLMFYRLIICVFSFSMF